MPDLKLPNLNNVIIAGRLTRDPEPREIVSGGLRHNTCTFGLAAGKKYKTKSGEDREDRLFLDVQAWGKTAEYLTANVHKGRPALVEGALRMDEWEDKATGQKRSKIYVVADNVQTLDWPADGAQRPAQQAPRGAEPPADYPGGQDDIQF